MKSILGTTLTIIACSSLVTPALGNETVSLKGTSERNLNRITPFSLITAGYHGRLQNQGIPGGAGFLTKIRSNKIEARDLVTSAIASGSLPKATLEDTAYLNQVDSLIKDLDLI